jgi:futalosine hydrolase
MSIRILYLTATSAEAESLKKIAEVNKSGRGYLVGNTCIDLLITGVGSVATAWSLKNWLMSNEKPDLIINGGIAGSFRDNIKIGDVVMPVSDCFADAGIEDGDNFLTMFEAGFAGEDDFPYSAGLLMSDIKYVTLLEGFVNQVKAITVNKATGSDETKNKLVNKFNPDIETMEGATFFYLCIRERINFLALRAVSNRIERRKRDKWNIPLALDNLSEKLKEIILTLD